MTSYERLVTRIAIIKAAKHFPLLESRMARRQAKSLLRARAYVAALGQRPWVPGPTVLK